MALVLVCRGGIAGVEELETVSSSSAELAAISVRGLSVAAVNVMPEELVDVDDESPALVLDLFLDLLLGSLKLSEACVWPRLLVVEVDGVMVTG